MIVIAEVADPASVTVNFILFAVVAEYPRIAPVLSVAPAAGMETFTTPPTGFTLPTDRAIVLGVVAVKGAVIFTETKAVFDIDPFVQVIVYFELLPTMTTCDPFVAVDAVHVALQLVVPVLVQARVVLEPANGTDIGLAVIDTIGVVAGAGAAAGNSADLLVAGAADDGAADPTAGDTEGVEPTDGDVPEEVRGTAVLLTLDTPVVVDEVSGTVELYTEAFKSLRFLEKPFELIDVK